MDLVPTTNSWSEVECRYAAGPWLTMRTSQLRREVGLNSLPSSLRFLNSSSLSSHRDMWCVPSRSLGEPDGTATQRVRARPEAKWAGHVVHHVGPWRDSLVEMRRGSSALHFYDSSCRCREIECVEPLCPGRGSLRGGYVSDLSARDSTAYPRRSSRGSAFRQKFFRGCVQPARRYRRARV